MLEATSLLPPLGQVRAQQSWMLRQKTSTVSTRVSSGHNCSDHIPTYSTQTCGIAYAADEKVSSVLKTQIVQARTAKKMTQAQLAQVSRGTLVATPEQVVGIAVIAMMHAGRPSAGRIAS